VRVGRLWPLAAPALVAIALVLGSNVSSAGHPLELLRPLAWVILGSTVVTLATWAAIRRPIPAGWIASAIVAWVLGTSLTWVAIIMVGLGVVVTQQLQRIRGRRPIRVSTTAVLAPALALCGLSVFQLVAEGIIALDDFMLTPASAVIAADGDLPSIYVLMLDGYPRADELQSRFGYDNQPFLDELVGLGLIVHTDASSRFARTELTLASSMMTDPAELDPYVGNELPELYETWRHLRRKYFVNVPMMDSLREAGYRLDYVTTEVSHSEWRGWDVTHDSGQLTDVETRIVQRSTLRSLLDGWVMDQQRARVEASLSTFGRLGHDPTQKVVLAHITPPHSPFLWGPGRSEAKPPRCWYQRACSLLSVSGADLDLDNREYGERLGWQLDTLNEMVLQTVRDVVKADPDAMIVVMSDHGTRFGPPSDEYHHTLLATRIPGAPDLFVERPGPDALFVRLLDQAQDP
jgi:hypothetical protein